VAELTALEEGLAEGLCTLRRAMVERDIQFGQTGA